MSEETKATEELTGDTGAKAADEPGGDTGAKMYSEEEVQRLVDRSISKAHEKWRAETDSKVEAERKKAEEDRLREQGEYSKLYEERDAELRALKAEIAQREFSEESRQALQELGVADVADVLLGKRDSVDDVKSAGQKLKEHIDALVQKGVEERLNTGTRPGGAKGAASVGAPDISDDAAREQYIRDMYAQGFSQQQVRAKLAELALAKRNKDE